MSENKKIYLIEIDEGDYIWSDTAKPDQYIDDSDVTEYVRADCIDILIAAAELYIKEPYCNQRKALQQAIKEAKG